LYQPEQKDAVITVYDIVRLVADVNNTSRKWNLHQYLYAWQSLKVREYEKIKEVYSKTKITITTLLQAYSGMTRTKATDMFMEGTYTMEDESKGDQYIKYLAELKSFMPRNTMLYTALLVFFRKYEESYDNRKMLEIVRSKKDSLLAESPEVLLVNLENWYKLAS
jgi:hypothetical protein